MSATAEGISSTLPNLAFTLIMKSVRPAPAPVKAPSHQPKVQTPTPRLAVPTHPSVDVKA